MNQVNELKRKTSLHNDKLSKSTTSLNQLKKTTQNNPLLQFNLSEYKINIRQNKSRGKLRLGGNIKPSIILSKQQRKNPFHRQSIITQDLVNKKGILGLLSMGVVSVQADYHQILNNRYQFVEKQVEPIPTFLTNPAILINTYYEINKQKDSQTNIQIDKDTQIKKQPIQKIQKIRTSKKKVVKKQEPMFFIPEQKVKLTVLNGKFQQNEAYTQYIKRLRKQGLEIQFRIYSIKIQQFSKKYSLKKFAIVPELVCTKKITDKSILESIPNSKLLGIHRRLNTPLQIFAKLFKTKIQKIRYRKIREALCRLQRVKGKFKIKKFYRQMLSRRWDYLTFKLASFSESQRRTMEHNTSRIQVQIHLIAHDRTQKEMNTFYKWRERSMAHLMRLYNNESDHIIIIHDRSIQFSELVQEIEMMPSSWKKPQIHVIQTNLGTSNSEQVADIYFGLRSQDIYKIKAICQNKKCGLIPYRISKYLPHICQMFGVPLFAGSFLAKANHVLFQDDNIVKVEQGNEVGVKFTKIRSNNNQLTKFYKQKLMQVQLTNTFLQSKQKIKELFIDLKLLTPLSLCISNMNQRDFFECLVKMIIDHKENNLWILKLPNSTFSRGLALFQTDSLKIIKDNKKKTVVHQEDLDQMSRLIESILIQKIVIPHNSLLSGQQFMSNFKQMGGYIQIYHENSQSVCIFGRIQFNGRFTLLGSYKRYYAQNICFGAIYPGVDITEYLLQKIKYVCSELYKLNFFGYFTLELLFNNKTGQYLFIDFVPHLEIYSQLYFYYKRILNINQIDGNISKLNKKIFYCPFIDNNGNKCQNFAEFQNLLISHKIRFNSVQNIGTKFISLSNNIPNVVSIFCIQNDETSLVKECLDVLNFLVETGNQFNKFDKKAHNSQSDGLYLLDIIWKMRQIKRECL